MNESVWRRARALVDRASRLPHYRAVELHLAGYAEPGYDDPASGIIATANWNPASFAKDAPKAARTMPRLAARLERLGVALEWADEWASCAECGKLVRVQPDSYGWQRSYWESPEGLICRACVLRDPGPYLRFLEGNPAHCLTFALDLREHGYRLLEDGFEYGLHEGQDASPAKIAQALEALGVSEYIFTLDSSGQFDVSFSVWVKEGEPWQRVQAQRERWQEAAKRCDIAPAEACRKALAEAPVEAPSGAAGPLLVKARRDGSAEVRVVAPEEFREGRGLD